MLCTSQRHAWWKHVLWCWGLAFFEHIFYRFFSTRVEKEELDTDNPFWEFIDEPKHPQKKEETEENSEPDDEGEDEKISDEKEDEENEHDESAYDGDDDEN